MATLTNQTLVNLAGMHFIHLTHGPPRLTTCVSKWLKTRHSLSAIPLEVMSSTRIYWMHFFVRRGMDGAFEELLIYCISGVVGLQAALLDPQICRGIVVLNISLRLLHIKKQPWYGRPLIRSFQNLLRLVTNNFQLNFAYWILNFIFVYNGQKHCRWKVLLSICCYTRGGEEYSLSGNQLNSSKLFIYKWEYWLYCDN